MKLTEEQIIYLQENYGIEYEILMTYLETIIDLLKENEVEDYTNEQLYECLEICCEKEQSNEFEKMAIAGLTKNMPEEEKEKILEEVAKNRGKILSNAFEQVFELNLLNHFFKYLNNKNDYQQEESLKK